MKKITRNLNIAWPLAILFSTVPMQGMESNILELTTESNRCLASTEVTKSYLWSTASLWGGLFLITTGGPVSGTFLCAYGAMKFFDTLRLQEKAEALKEVAAHDAQQQEKSKNERKQQAAEQRECCICQYGPDNGIRLMDIPCDEIHPDRICVGCYQGIMKKNALCPSCRRELQILQTI